MAESTLLSGSTGTFWGVTSGGEWTGPLLLKNATVTRTQTRTTGTPADIISSSGSSDDGKVNTVTILDVAASYNSGASASNPACAYFGFPVTKKDGSAVNLGSDRFTLDLFLELTAIPGETDNNDCFVMIGVNDGDSDMDATLGAAFIYDNTNQRVAVFSNSGGRSMANCAGDPPYLRALLSTAPSGSNPTRHNPINGIHIFAFDGNTNEYKNHRNMQGNSTMGTKYQSTGLPTGSQTHVFIALGRTVAGQGEKDFSFKAYYKLSLHTFNDNPTERPG
jgi:hypothetical protein